MRRLLTACLLLLPALASAQVSFGGVNAPIFGLPSVNGGSITPASAGFPATTCAAPGIYYTAGVTTGIAFTATPSVILCVNGTAVVTTTSTAVTSTVPVRTSDGSAGTPSLSFANQTNLGFFASAANIMDFSSNGTSAMAFAPDYLWIKSQTGILYFGSATDVALSRGAAGQPDWSSAAGVRQGSTQTTDPTCSSNCGTSPSALGTDSEFTLTMGASGVPASGFVITFNGTWASAPQCVGSMALTGMAVGKLPLTVVTTTTTITVVTNGTAPATSDKYHFICRGGR